MKLKDKIALVTGASTGIGQAIAMAFAREGAFVYLAARTIDRLNDTKERIVREGGNADILMVDLSNPDSVNECIGTIKGKTKTVDILANIAGVWHGENEAYAGKDFETFDQKVILDTFFVGLLSPTLLVHSLIPMMPKNGKIVNLSGTFENGAKGWLPYYVSKKGIEDLTVGLSEELMEKDIQVNGISPSDTATDAYKHFFPQYIAEAIEPVNIAQFAVYLCSEEANKTTGKIYVLKKDTKPFEGFHS